MAKSDGVAENKRTIYNVVGRISRNEQGMANSTGSAAKAATTTPQT